MRFRTEMAAAFAAIALLGIVTFTPAAAQEAEQKEAATAPAVKGMPPQDPIGYRRQVKAAMQAHLSAFGLILMFRVPYDDQFAMHADALVALAEAHKSLYPEGSGGPESSPLIWEQPEEFAAAANRTSEAAARLKATVEAKNRHAMMNALVRFGESCEGCHAKFRQKAR